MYGGISLAYADQGLFAQAIENSEKAISLDPKDPSLHETLASIYVRQDNLDGTFKELKKANELRTTPPTNPGPYYYLGTTYVIRFMQKRNEEDFNEAVKWLTKCTEIRANYPSAYTALGVLYEKHSNVDLALANYQKAADYDANNPASYVQLADAYINLKSDDQAALGYLKRAIQLKPDSAEALSRLGLLYHRQHNDAEAIKQLLQAINSDPKYLEALFNLSLIYKERKEFTEAIKYLAQAIEIKPSDFMPYKEMAKVYEEQGQNESAVHYYEEAITRLGPGDASTKTLYLGRIARLRGQYAEAISYFQKLGPPFGPDQTTFEIGMTYVAARNKKAALEQHQQLVQMKSSQAKELLRKINDMK